MCNSKKLFETSQKILSHNDVKKVSDLKYSRYANIAQINDKQYLLEFVIKGKLLDRFFEVKNWRILGMT